MKTNILNFTLTIILAFILSLVLPWWSVMLAGFIIAFLIPLKKIAVFFVPFFAILIFWSVYCLLLGSGNDFILANRIAILLPLEGNPYLLIAVTGIIGGLAAGIAATFGNQSRLFLRKS